MFADPSPSPLASSSPTQAPAATVSHTAVPVNGWSTADKWAVGTDAAIGALSVGIALWALIFTRREANRGIGRLADERQRLFDLEVLRDLADRLDATATTGGVKRGTLTAKLAMLPDDELPSWHVVNRGGELDPEIVSAAYEKDMLASNGGLAPAYEPSYHRVLRHEISAAIDRRKSARE